MGTFNSFGTTMAEFACSEFFRKSDEASAKLPEVMTKLKRKYLIAISKNSEHKWSKEDEDFVKEVLEDVFSYHFLDIFNGSYQHSLFWDDSKASDAVKTIIEQNATFLLQKYLESAKIIFLVYSGTSINDVDKRLNYVLTHARQFGDPSKQIFAVNNDNASSKPIYTDDTHVSTLSLPRSKFMDKISQLINDLKNSYEETKFRILNVNVTYIALLMLRRVVKNETEFLASMERIQTHDNYVKLCPWPLDKILPKSDTSKLIQSRLKECAYLPIHAYLNGTDEKTKNILKGTCVQYMEWCGLQLPHLYFKVVDIYQMDAGELWDILNTSQTKNSLIQLANDYYDQTEILKKDPLKTQHWFPYCRVLNDSYHTKLSASQNRQTCIILAYLVDFKIGLDKSNLRLSHWAKSMDKYPWSKSAQKYAKDIYEKHVEKSSSLSSGTE